MNRELQTRHRQGELQMVSLDRLMEMIRTKLADKFDLVVGIERGGVLPAYLASRWLDAPLKTIKLPSRDGNHPAQRGEAHWEHPLIAGIRGIRVLLADDVANTGVTLRRVAQNLAGARITTMVISGEADISLLGPHEKCIHWPWDR